MPNTPPVGSVAMAMRPLPGISIGSNISDATVLLTSFAVASASSLAR